MTNNNQKLWLCGMISGDRQILEKSISKVLKYFDGCIFVVDDRARPEDVQWLESVKGQGKIILKKWANDHAHTSNEVLLSGTMKWPDYFIWIDQTDEINEVFAQDLRESITYWHKNNVGMVYLDHPFVLRFHDGLRFDGNPHWFCKNIIGQTVNLSQINGWRKECYLFNHRDTLKSGFVSPAKYWVCYPAFSNHTQLLYGQFSPQIHSHHENIRINFQFYCKEVLGLDLSNLDYFISYLQTNIGNYPQYLENIIEHEICVKDLFRLFVLKQDWKELDGPGRRFDWSYYHWKKTGEIIQDPSQTGYIGVFNQYKIQKGEQPE